jgi:hypothetical protein
MSLINKEISHSMISKAKYNLMIYHQNKFQPRKLQFQLPSNLNLPNRNPNLPNNKSLRLQLPIKNPQSYKPNLLPKPLLNQLPKKKAKMMTKIWMILKKKMVMIWKTKMMIQKNKKKRKLSLKNKSRVTTPTEDFSTRINHNKLPSHKDLPQPNKINLISIRNHKTKVAKEVSTITTVETETLTTMIAKEVTASEVETEEAAEVVTEEDVEEIEEAEEVEASMVVIEEVAAEVSEVAEEEIEEAVEAEVDLTTEVETVETLIRISAEIDLLMISILHKLNNIFITNLLIIYANLCILCI